VSITIGKPFLGGVVGGVMPVGSGATADYGAMSIDSKSGAGMTSGGDIPATQTLPSFGQTLLASVGVDPGAISGSIQAGTIIQGALA
jgi:hypothetical protein